MAEATISGAAGAGTDLMKTDLFINNEWRAAASGNRFDVINPATEETVAEVAKAVSGVSVAGFRMTVQPAASAGANFQLARLSGKFQGTMAPTTPTGSRSV